MPPNSGGYRIRSQHVPLKPCSPSLSLGESLEHLYTDTLSYLMCLSYWSRVYKLPSGQIFGNFSVGQQLTLKFNIFHIGLPQMKLPLLSRTSTSFNLLKFYYFFLLHFKDTEIKIKIRIRV